MMISRQTGRFFSCTTALWGSVSKSDLSRLRKKTGYTFSNCKKALELNKDFESAEKWLQEQALALGWEKAAKLQGRKTLQGLIGVALKGNSAVMLEVNCETDFVGRNKKFQTLVEQSTASCLTHLSQKEPVSDVSKVLIGSEELKSIKTPDGKTLAELAALAISDLGENINLRRAVVMSSPESVHLSAYVHPSSTGPHFHKLMSGKYGAVMACEGDFKKVELQHIGRQLCQHVVGMNPKKVGKEGEDEPVPNRDDEQVMIHQEFLLEPDITVGELISNHNIKILDFARLECGESTEDSESPIPLRASG